MAFLEGGRDVGDGSFIQLPHVVHFSVRLHQTDVTEPRPIVEGVFCDFVFVHEPALAHYDVFDGRLVAELLLVDGVQLEDLLALLLWQSVQGELVNHSGPLVLWDTEHKTASVFFFTSLLYRSTS